MKRIGELTGAGQLPIGQQVDVTAADTGPTSTVRLVFGRMHGAYGAAWLDKWRTGVIDPQGRDRGVASAMVEWALALAPFDTAVLERACEIVQDGGRRAFAQLPPSKPEFIGICRGLVPPKASPPALVSRVDETAMAEGRERLAAIKAQTLQDRTAEFPGALERLHDLIVEAYRLAGGRLEELTQWHMVELAS